MFDELSHLGFSPSLPETFYDVVFKTEFASQIGKVLHLLQRVLATIQIFPYSATRPDPSSLKPLRKQRLVRRLAKARYYVAVHQAIQVWTNHHHSPWRGYCSGKYGRFCEPLLVAGISQFERMTRRQCVTKARIKPVSTTGLQPHSAVIHQCGLGDCGIAKTARQLHRQRRRRPFAILHRGYVLPGVNPFVVALEIVKPHHASGWNGKSG